MNNNITDNGYNVSGMFREIQKQVVSGNTLTTMVCPIGYKDIVVTRLYNKLVKRGYRVSKQDKYKLVIEHKLTVLVKEHKL